MEAKLQRLENHIMKTLLDAEPSLNEAKWRASISKTLADASARGVSIEEIAQVAGITVGILLMRWQKTKELAQ